MQVNKWAFDGPLSLLRFAYLFIVNCLLREANNKMFCARCGHKPESNLLLSLQITVSWDTEFTRGNEKCPLAYLSAKISGQL